MALHTIIAVRQKEPLWVEVSTSDFAKRMAGKLTEIAIRPPPRTLGKPTNILLQLEASAINKVLMQQPQDAWIIVLDIRGKMMSTEILASKLLEWQTIGRLIWIVGGADGLDESILTRANIRLSLSPMTLPHHLARLVLLEQIYRASSINMGHPYHHI